MGVLNMNKKQKRSVANEGNKKGSEIDWTYTDSVRPLLRKQPRAAFCNGQALCREREFGFTVDQHLIVLVCAEHRECASKSGRAWLESSRKSSAKLRANQSVYDSFYGKREGNKIG